MQFLIQSKAKQSGVTVLTFIALAVGLASASEHGAGQNKSGLIDPHIVAISASPLEVLMPQYADDARLEWIGGPLNGSYDGSDAIEGAWSRFIGVRGEMQADIEDYIISENPKGRTIIASVLYRGEKTIPVRLITTYRDGKITTEIWQIDPVLSK